ncbi:hypothetical protein MPSI1_000781 [Malassezia psittaci]|uniref:Transcription initiation factor TFIID subunit 13 n=1 Tax=Malassezia psittaci TaxID=1821823 RepID=A0AAF0FCB3_9BASI|nr:hypothetical protein MPSI1_000781 [Malassezia psittaci]
MPPTTPLRYIGGRGTPYESEARPQVQDVRDGLPASYRADIVARGRRPFHQPGLFQKDLRLLMYAYGDVPNPSPDSVAVLEEMTMDFLTDLCLRAEPSAYALGFTASHIAAEAIENGETPSSSLHGHPPAIQTHRQRANLDDFKRALRHDRKKLGRLEQLLYADKMVTEARRIGVLALW